MLSSAGRSRKSKHKAGPALLVTAGPQDHERLSSMAKKTVSQQTARIVALGIAAKGELETAVRTLDESRAALQVWADELTIDAENAHQSAVGVQAEAIRLAMSALSVRAASERLAVVSQLATDATGGAL